jgi:hypothetical protein
MIARWLLVKTRKLFCKLARLYRHYYPVLYIAASQAAASLIISSDDDDDDGYVIAHTLA